MHLTRVRGPKTWRAKSALVKLWPGFERSRKLLNAALGVTFDTVPEGVTSFVILAMARSGSTLLIERLSAGRASLRSDGEVLNPLLRGSSTMEDVIRKTYFTHTGHRIVGCKILADQISDEELRVLAAIPGLRVVILERMNIVRQFVSHRIAIRDQHWSQAAGANRSSAARRIVDVSTSELLEFRQ